MKKEVCDEGEVVDVDRMVVHGEDQQLITLFAQSSTRGWRVIQVRDGDVFNFY